MAPGEHDAQWRADLHEFLFSQIAAAYAGRSYNDPRYPDFAPMFNQLFNQGFPNPDDSYYLTPIEDHGVYRISGFRGSVRVVFFQIGGGTAVPYGTGPLGPSKAVYDIDELTLGKDGAFDVVLSPERPKDWQGNWWHLPPASTHIVVRQRAYDWLKEVDGRFAIERLDLPAARPRRGDAQIDTNLRAVADWVSTYAMLSLDGPWVRHLRESGIVNRLQPRDYRKPADWPIEVMWKACSKSTRTRR